MTWMSLLGVTIGVAAMVVVLSVMGGFEQDLRRRMLKGLPHLELWAKDAQGGFSLKEKALDSLLQSQGEGKQTPFIRQEVLLRAGGGLAAGTFLGVQPEKGGEAWELEAPQGASFEDLKSSPGELPGLFLSRGLVQHLALKLGQCFWVLSPHGGSLEAVGGGSFVRPYRLLGVMEGDLFRFQQKLLVGSLEEARYFMADYDPLLQEENYVSGVAFRVPEGRILQLKGGDLRLGKLPLRWRTWKDSNGALLFAIGLERWAMGCILLLILLVAAFSISGTLMMGVFHRRGQIALLRALGFRPKDVLLLFLIQGRFLARLGGLLGLSLGLGFCCLIYFQVKSIALQPGLYYLQSLPVRFLFPEYGIISLCAWLLGIWAASYPAWKASKEDPVGGLRFR